MLYREASVNDIKQIQLVRNAVKENVLSDPGLVTDDDCRDYIINRGKGWVCEVDERVVGFAIADLQANNIWTLFIEPDFERRGIDKRLHRIMLDWYFSQTSETVWLSTAPRSRAEEFYRRQGWKETGLYGKGETKFEMSADDWRNQSLQMNNLFTL